MPANDTFLMPASVLEQSIETEFALNDKAFARLLQLGEAGRAQQSADIQRRAESRAFRAGGTGRGLPPLSLGAAPRGGPQTRGGGSAARSTAAKNTQQLQEAEKAIAAAMKFSEQPGATTQQREELQQQIVSKYGMDVIAQTTTGPQFMQAAAKRREELAETRNQAVAEYKEQHGVPAIWDEKLNRPVPDAALVEAQYKVSQARKLEQEPQVELAKQQEKLMDEEYRQRVKENDKRLELSVRANGATPQAFAEWRQTNATLFKNRRGQPDVPAAAPQTPDVPQLPPALGRKVVGEFETFDDASGDYSVGDVIKVGGLYYEISSDGTPIEVR